MSEDNAGRDSIDRIIRREHIAKELYGQGEGEREPLSEIKKTVRKKDEEKRGQVDKLVNDLFTKEFVVTEETRALVEELYEKTKERFPEAEFAFVILGSSGRGGEATRKIVGTEMDFDLDMGMIEKNVDEDEAAEMESLIMEVIKEKISRGELPPKYRLCTRYNPWFYREKRCESVNEAYEKLTSYPADLLIYFSPTIPVEVGEKNRGMVLEALTKLYKNDHEKWKAVVKDMLDKWEDLHHLKDKHLSGEFIWKRPLKKVDEKTGRPTKPLSREIDLRHKAASKISEKMQDPMKKLLMSTKESK